MDVEKRHRTNLIYISIHHLASYCHTRVKGREVTLIEQKLSSRILVFMMPRLRMMNFFGLIRLITVDNFG